MSNGDWHGLVNALGLPNLATDPRFVEISDRVRNTHLIHGELQAAFLARTTAEWLPLLRDADAVFAPINSTDGLHLDEQVQALGSIIEVEHPAAGACRQPVHPARFAETPAALWRHAPKLGEHNEDVLGTDAGTRSQRVA
jgi:crotonobetainyl-CoA:carnitine CoA-transferase CaiB-like acyl-CoA transferase